MSSSQDPDDFLKLEFEETTGRQSPIIFGTCLGDQYMSNMDVLGNLDLNLVDIFSNEFLGRDGSLLDFPATEDLDETSYGDNFNSLSTPCPNDQQVVEGQIFGNIITAPMAPLDNPLNRFQKSKNDSNNSSSTQFLTEEQKIERRERNREHAKRSRVRKKFILESLQKSVNDLNHENQCLRESIKRHLGPKGDKLIAQCAPDNDSLYSDNPSRANRILDDPDYSLVKALQIAQQNFVITDASLPDNPIVYASGGFLTLTGYELSDILGRNCRFLQGPETDPRSVDKIRKAITAGGDTSVCLLNYRKDGSTFWNQFYVSGLNDSNGNIVNYVGVQSKVSEAYAQLLVHKQNMEFEGKC
mmetsp:Transcript_10828/g.16156  ORF Transcript_10828/g.16156 Transcript_10828/m.16156 type:complete len:357 (+) Transcript_10828:5-1075(+)